MSIAGAQRTDVIAHLDILERAGDPSLSAITRVAAFICGAPGAAIHIHDDTVQHRVGATFVPIEEHPREDSLCRLAAHDTLTGAVNRLVLGDRLAQAFARRRRHSGETFVALLDVDEFKLINDRHGHDAGDQVLIAVAERLRDAVRDEDTIARIGGDEFVVLAELVPKLDLRDALCERIEHALAEPIEFGGALRPLRVSAGCVLADVGEDVRTLLGRADAAMYERKRERRRVRSGAPAAD